MGSKACTYPVMEIFHSLQGEGFNTGKPAVFIRLAGCDVGCSWCDVKESWDADAHPVMNVEQILEEAAKFPADNVVVTGGEPAMYDLGPLTSSLKQAGKTLWLETSGAHPITGGWDWICLSPKKFKPVLKENFSLAHELKIIVVNRSDLEWAGRLAGKVSGSCHLFLQPEWDRREKTEPLAIAFIRDNPQWRLSIQTHKYLNIR